MQARTSTFAVIVKLKLSISMKRLVTGERFMIRSSVNTALA